MGKQPRKQPTMRASTPEDLERDRRYAALDPEVDDRDPAVVASGYKPEDSRRNFFMDSVNDLLSLYSPGEPNQAIMNREFIKNPEKINQVLSRLKYRPEKHDTVATQEVKDIANQELQRMQQNPHGRRRILAHYAGLKDQTTFPRSTASMEPQSAQGQAARILLGKVTPTHAPSTEIVHRGVKEPVYPNLALNVDMLANKTGDPLKSVNPETIAHNIGHETRHVAGILVNPKGREVKLPDGSVMKKRSWYDEYDHLESLHGYEKNPEEIAAELAGATEALRSYAARTGTKLPRDIRNLAKDLVKSPIRKMYDHYLTMSHPPAAAQIGGRPTVRPGSRLLDIAIESVLNRRMKMRGGTGGGTP